MRIAVLGSAKSWYLADLRRAAADRHELVALDYRHLAGAVAEGRLSAGAAGRELGECDALLVRSLPPGSLEQVVFRMDLLGCLAAAGVTVVNPPRAVETAVDKFLTTARLAAAGLPVPRTWVGQDIAGALAAFENLGRDVVLKPLFGSEGRGLVRLTDPELAWRAFTLLEQAGSVIYLQEFVPHPGWDLRVLILGPKAWGLRRVNPGDWRTNVSRGARGEPAELDDATLELARRAAAAVAAEMAGVDLVRDAEGRWQLLEVNAVPGWRGLAGAYQTDIAAEVLGYLVTVVAARRG